MSKHDYSCNVWLYGSDPAHCNCPLPESTSHHIGAGDELEAMILLALGKRFMNERYDAVREVITSEVQKVRDEHDECIKTEVLQVLDRLQSGMVDHEHKDYGVGYFLTPDVIEAERKRYE